MHNSRLHRVSNRHDLIAALCYTLQKTGKQPLQCTALAERKSLAAKWLAVAQTRAVRTSFLLLRSLTKQRSMKAQH